MQISNRVKEMTSFIVMDVLEKAQEIERRGNSVVHLEIGEPDFNLPDCVKEAVNKAIAADHTHYTHSMGMIELREAVCKHYLKLYNVSSLVPDQVVINSGTSPAMLTLFSVLLNRDDQVIISDPHYSCYPNFIKYARGEPIFAPIYEENGLQYNCAEIKKRISTKTRGIIISSPSNPTGSVMSADCMQEITELTKPDLLYIISDEIYHGLTYDKKAHSILEFTDNAFVLNGFSKRYAMTGLRLGYLIAPLPFIRSIQKVQQNFFVSPNSIVQIAGIAALESADKDVKRMRDIFNERRLYMLRRLRAMGFRIDVEPAGAFFIFVNAKHLCKDSYSLAFDILDKDHVGVTPGIDFGKNGEGYLRFSYANSLENIAEGMDRLEKYLCKKYYLDLNLRPDMEKSMLN